MAKATRLITLSFRKSEELPSLGDFKAYLATDFGHRVPGFIALDHDAKWGNAVLDLVGKAMDGRLVAVFPSVSVHERDLHEVIANSMLSSSWLEDNRGEMERLYDGSGVNLDHPLRMILVVPALANLSRSMRRALERAGLEIMSYSIYDLTTPDGLLGAVSFDDGPPAAPAVAPLREVANSEVVAPRRFSLAEPPSPRVEAPITSSPIVAAAPEPVRPEALRTEPLRAEPMRPEPVLAEPMASEPVRPEPV